MSEEQLDTETLVFRQIDRVLRTASMERDGMMSDESGIDVSTWSHRVLYSSKFFHAFLDPIKSKEKNQEIMENASENVRDDQRDVWRRMDFAEEIFKENIKVLHENNTVFQESDDMVIEDKKDELLEPESSDVDEEVID